MNRKVEHYLLVGHSRNALRNYSNQIAAAVWKLASGETGQLKTECSFWPKTVVAPRTKKHKTWQMNVPFLHCPLMFFLTRCRIYDNLKIWMGGMNYVNVSPTYFSFLFFCGSFPAAHGWLNRKWTEQSPSIISFSRLYTSSRTFIFTDFCWGKIYLLVNYCQPKLMSSFLSCRRTFWLTNCYLYSVW